VIFWPRETATLLKSNLRYFHHDKCTFEKFDAGLKLRIVFYTRKTIKNRRKNIRVIYALKATIATDSHHTFPKMCPRGISSQLLKTAGANKKRHEKLNENLL